LARVLVPVAQHEQKRQEHEPDEQLVPQVNDGDVADLVQAIGTAEQADAEHPVLEAGHQEGEVQVFDAQPRLERASQGEQRPIDGEHQHKDHQILRLELHLQEGDEQHRGQRQGDNQLAQVVHRALGDEATAANPVAEADQEQDGQHAVEDQRGVVHARESPFG